jgi:predicted dehydrogenase
VSHALRVALAGFGYWGPNLARNLHDTDGASLMAIADARAERLVRASKHYPAAELVTDAASLAERDDVDAIVIATPLSTHYPLANAALEHGKHVLIEKPMAATVREAEALVEIADRCGVTLMVDHTFVYTGAVRKLKELVDAGELGDLLYLDSVRVNLGLFQHDTNVIWDLAPHDLSIMDYLIGDRPVAVSAHGAAVAGFEHESIAYITVHFAGGFLGHFHVNWMAPVKIRRMLLGGRRKMVTFDDLEPSEKVRVYDSGVDFDVSDDEARRRVLVSYRTGDMYAPRLERQEALAGIAREFVAAATAGRAPLTDGAAGVRVVRMLEAADQSLRQQGQRVAL